MRVLISVFKSMVWVKHRLVPGHIHTYVEIPSDIKTVAQVLRGDFYMAKYCWILAPDHVLLSLHVELDGKPLAVLFLILEGGDHSYAHLLHG